ncbi:MAG: protein translocase subunit SecD [Planctomycetota bacterium]
MDCRFLSDLSLIAQADAGKGISLDQIAWIVGALAVLILPFVVGGFLAKRLKMPNLSTQLGFVLLAVVASAAVLANRLPGLGVDLRGGTIIVYEIDPTKSDPEGDGGNTVKSKDLIGPLTKRINPSGTREIVLRPYGDTQIEVIVPEVDQREVDQIKTDLTSAGILRFAIVANRVDHQREIELATQKSESPNPEIKMDDAIVDSDGRMIARWVVADVEEAAKSEVKPFRVHLGNAIVRNQDTGDLVELPADTRGKDGESLQAEWVAEQGMSGLEILMVINPDCDVKGEDLAFSNATFDERGAPAVAFTLNDAGSGRFRFLTTENSPDGNRERQLGIVLDDRLLSAPTIRSTISKRGQITGNFTTEEVRSLVDILRAGQLPAALTKQPIAENQIDATLGADTIRKGVIAITVSLGLVLLFILYYYRFAGLIACIALLLNLAMILATMVLINQPLTLPGLAGLVLTVGMSVDANVLIFERIREEIKKGAKDRMAIRNGFAKATVTIVDANLTTLFTAIVLYAIGTDQIRGFAVTLILGILFSMFTAIYMSRTLFDIAERHNKLTLSMSDSVNSIRKSLSGDGVLDFIGKGKLTLAISSVLILIGIASLFVRGKDILDIDFAGGSSVQFRVAEATDDQVIRDTIEAAVAEGVQFTVNGVTMDEAPADTVFKVDSSFENVDDLKDAVVKAFAGSDTKLVTYKVDVEAAANQNSMRSSDNGVMLTVLQDETAGDENAQPEDASPEDTEPAADADEGDAESVVPAEAAAPSQSVKRVLKLGIEGGDSAAKLSGPTLIKRLKMAADELNIPFNERVVGVFPSGEGVQDWKRGSSLPFSEWSLTLPMSDDAADRVLAKLDESLSTEPIWVSSSSVGGRVAGQMIGRASVALFASLLVIIGYIWFRFQRVMYGLAAVAALVHDVLITLGAIAVSFYLADFLGVLGIDEFKISLTVVAALLTIIGYSLNDTIVVFDRIRETKGKAPRLTSDMINISINQTLSRTLLTSLTTLIVVVLLYAFGGEGIHAFAFALVVGVLVGTYSSIFVASPILMMLVTRAENKAAAAS